jgi:hypothetical protein
MNKTTKILVYGVAALAVIGVTAFIFTRRRGQMQQQASSAESQGGAIGEIASRALDKIGGSQEAQQQRLANRRVRQSTRQAKLLKRGKITLEDLSKLQQV